MKTKAEIRELVDEWWGTTKEGEIIKHILDLIPDPPAVMTAPATWADEMAERIVNDDILGLRFTHATQCQGVLLKSLPSNEVDRSDAIRRCLASWLVRAVEERGKVEREKAIRECAGWLCDKHYPAYPAIAHRMEQQLLK